MREIKFKLWDKAFECFVPNDTYAVLNSDRKDQLAICIKDWEGIKEGEIWYDFQARLDIEYYDTDMIDALIKARKDLAIWLDYAEGLGGRTLDTTEAISAIDNALKKAGVEL